MPVDSGIDLRLCWLVRGFTDCAARPLGLARAYSSSDPIIRGLHLAQLPIVEQPGPDALVAGSLRRWENGLLRNSQPARREVWLTRARDLLPISVDY